MSRMFFRQVHLFLTMRDGTYGSVSLIKKNIVERGKFVLGFGIGLGLRQRTSIKQISPKQFPTCPGIATQLLGSSPGLILYCKVLTPMCTCLYRGESINQFSLRVQSKSIFPPRTGTGMAVISTQKLHFSVVLSTPPPLKGVTQSRPTQTASRAVRKS